MNPPLVAVYMITYNHENYIAQAIDSVLTQKTTFPIKIFIGEDCSTDQTAAICLKYKEENKEIIEVILNKQNIGQSNNAKQIYEASLSSGAKYIAILEGDDYWTDPYKLQKQVDFLEANPEYGMVHTGANIVNSQNGLILISNDPKPKGDVFADLLKRAFIITTTVCIRADIIRALTTRVEKENLWYTIDYWTWAHCAMQSKVHFIQETTSSYRSHEFNITKNKGYFFQKRLPLIVLDIVAVRLAQDNPVSLSLAFLLSVNYNAAMLARRVAFKEKKKFLKLIAKHPWLLFGFIPSIIRKISNRIKHSGVGKFR